MTSLLLCALIAGTSVYTDTFNDANKAYLADDYHKAISLYEQLVSERITDPVVFYNLANAYYRTGQLAPAIANYERALQLDHRFDNARENLNTAVQQTQHRLERPLPPAWEQSVLFWHYGLPQRMTFMLAVGFPQVGHGQ